jgi:hypothetical protein
MNFDFLAKRLYLRMQPGRRNYQLKMLVVAVSFGLSLGGVLVTVMLWTSKVPK